MGAIPEQRSEPLHRQNRGVLQIIERPALRWLAAAMPQWVTPDMLTGTGFLGSVLAAIGYALARDHPTMLWLASAGFLVNWFGDSLDGNLARLHQIERPDYGFFIDNATDVLEYTIFAIGMGLSGYIPWELVLGALCAFYMMMLLELIKAQVTKVFQIAFGGIGLTEVRFGFIVLNTLMYFYRPVPLLGTNEFTNYAALITILWIGMQVTTFIVVTRTTLCDLATQDPSKRRR
jgi:archaetidylinositol phosphate synthase